MPDNKMKNQYSENSERQRMAAINEMEKYLSPMTKAFLRPAYDRTEICPDFSRRPSNQNKELREIAEGQKRYNNPLRMATSGWQQELGEHNDKVLDTIIALKKELEASAEIERPN